MRLHTLLCGPLLRRIEPTKVCIWLATSLRPESVEALVFPLKRAADKKSWEQPSLPTKTTYNVHQLGKNLWVILLEVSCSDPGATFKPLTLYGYDLAFKFNEKDKVILEEKHLDSKAGGPKDFRFTATYNVDKAYTYEDLPYPVFVIPSQDAARSRFFYGSCRRIQGPGSDALNAADKLLEREWREHTRNPKMRLPDYSLLMLGDQIYGDDTIDEVFGLMRELADALMGYDETIPELVGAAEITDEDLTKFLYNYFDGKTNYRLEDLNMPSKVAYLQAAGPHHRLANIELFLAAYLGHTIKTEVLGDLVQRRVRDIIAELKRLGFGARMPFTIDVNEVLPREYLRTTFPVQPRAVKDIRFDQRRNFLRRNASISTVDHGHALSFGEFAALYLLNWSRLTFLDSEALKAKWGKLWHLSYRAGYTHYDDDKLNLEGVFERNRRVVRLIANVPSYMIFDDHEITDEWNYDDLWRHAVEKKSATGRRMIANGLAAYWAFQAWGNDPRAFPQAMIEAIKAPLLDPIAGGTIKPDNAKKLEDTVLAFQDWAFTTPTNPIAVFLDNRTMRGPNEPMNYYPVLNVDDHLSGAPAIVKRAAEKHHRELYEGKRFQSVRLMSEAAFKKVGGLLAAAGYKRGTPVIFCAPTPIFGSPLFELGQQRMVDGEFNKDTVITKLKPARKPGRHDNDFESWSSNPRGKYDFFRFLDLVVQPSRVAILSGDVHYAFHASIDLHSVETKRTYAIEQLTSSALKNNTLDYIEKIDLLAYLSLTDTKDVEYKRIDEIFHDPRMAPVNGVRFPHYKVRGKLRAYSKLMDKDTWLIFHNNVGLLEVLQDNVGVVSFSNRFLSSPYSLGDIAVAHSIP